MYKKHCSTIQRVEIKSEKNNSYLHEPAFIFALTPTIDLFEYTCVQKVSRKNYEKLLRNNFTP